MGCNTGRFGGTYCLYLQDRRNKFSRSRRQAELAQLLVYLLAYFSILKIEAICSSETSGCLRAARRYNPETRIASNDEVERIWKEMVVA
jgi:hypothetical protein